MSDSDSETRALIRPAAFSKTSEYRSGSDETVTTDVEDYESFEDEVFLPSQFERRRTSDHSSENVVVDQPRRSSDIPNLKLDESQDAVYYSAGNFQSSSDGSKKIDSISSSVDPDYVMQFITESGDVNYVDIDFSNTVDEKNIAKLMHKLRLNHYTAISCEGDFTLSKCKRLFDRDYHCEIIENSGGSLCRNYPARLIIPVAEKSKTAPSERLNAMEFNTSQYAELVRNSVSSRLLTRFVAPVILFNKKFICRSGSLTVRKTAVFETARQKELPKSIQVTVCGCQQIARRLASALAEMTSRGCRAASQLFVPSSIQKLRDIDAEIMRSLSVQHVCDLMVENRKTFIQTIRISSSEKINLNTYCDCSIEQMPYPGCKLFKKYHEAHHNPEGLVFNWQRRDVSVEMQLSDDPYAAFPDINWENYKEWDLVDLTRNYFKILLLYLAKDSGSLLVHCISGWDRTPLFISMLRVSLWADGVIHESLDYRDMAYLTLAYDWYLFGHNLPERLRKKEEVMHFCFKFLAYIATDEFSVTRIFNELPLEQRRDRTFPPYEPGKRAILHVFSGYVLRTYDELITQKLR